LFAFQKYIGVLSEIGEPTLDSQRGKQLYETLVKTEHDRQIAAGYIHGMIERNDQDAQSTEEKDLYLVGLLWARQKVLGQTLGHCDPEAAIELINSVKREQIFSRTYRMVVEGADK
jgi:hypothetical protein